MFSYSNKIQIIGIILFSFLYAPFLGALMVDVWTIFNNMAAKP